MTATRRLAAILVADIAGYSRLIGADEEGTLKPATSDPNRNNRPAHRPISRARHQDDR